MGIGLKVSLPGFDVKTAAPEDCAIHSDYDTFKIDSSANPPHFGVVKITFNSNPPDDVITTLFSFDHGYNHRPSLMTYIDNGPVFLNTSTTGHVHFNVTDTAWIECNVTDTQFRIDVRNHLVDLTGAGAGLYPVTMTVRYYIFAEDGK